MDMWPDALHQIFTAAATLIRRHWRGLLSIRERLRFSEEAFHLLLAGLVGVVGGITNLVFSLCIDLVQALSLGHSGNLIEIAHNLAPWQRLIIPGLGGIVGGLVLYWGLRLVGPQGSNNILEAVVAGDGRLRMRSALVKATSSLVSIGTGASIGREGSITQLAATLVSKAGQLADWQPYRLRLLVACGAASGMAGGLQRSRGGRVLPRRLPSAILR